MIETVAPEKFYKDVHFDSLHPTVPKDPRVPCASSSTAAATPSRTTCSGGASSAPSANSGILKMLWGIFAMCWCADQCMDVQDQRLQIVRRSQEIIHSQWDEPFLEFPDAPVFLLVLDPYASLTPTVIPQF
jgi:hypothetical protein